MYGFKGFMEIDGLQSTTPGQVGTIGDLSSKAQTFSRSLAQYTTPTFPSLMLYSFKSRTESGNITIPALLQTQIFAVANWAYQYQRAQTAAITSGAFVAAASAQFSGQAVSFSCGEMIQADGFSFPSFIRWINPTLATNSPNAGAEVKIWFSDLAFQAQYDEYEIVVVPPIPNISLFHSGAAVVQAAIDAYSHNSLISAIQAASGVYPYTSLQARRFSYVDPTNVQNRIMTDWTLLIYGPAGNNIDAIQLAIQAYLLANSSQSEASWRPLFPEIYTSTEFYLLPRWKNIAIPAMTLQQGAYSSFLKISKELNYLKGIFQDFNAGFIETYAASMPTNYASLQTLVLPDSGNDDQSMNIVAIFPDLVDIPFNDTMFNMMSAKTRGWITAIETVLIAAERATADSTLPPGMSRVVRNNILFISREYEGVNYLVATKATTPAYS